MDDEVDATFTVHDVLDAMAHLTPVYRAVFNLYVFDNLGRQEISSRLGISVGTLEVESCQGEAKPSRFFVDLKRP